jgi:hypothetical protein
LIFIINGFFLGGNFTGYKSSHYEETIISNGYGDCRFIPFCPNCGHAPQNQWNTTAFYSNNALVDAYTAAANGDTIYLPGGGFAPPGAFDKGIIIYGVGHYPDSTAATNKTVISADLA